MNTTEIIDVTNEYLTFISNGNHHCIKLNEVYYINRIIINDITFNSLLIKFDTTEMYDLYNIKLYDRQFNEVTSFYINDKYNNVIIVDNQLKKALIFEIYAELKNNKLLTFEFQSFNDIKKHIEKIKSHLIKFEWYCVGVMEGKTLYEWNE